MNDVEAQKRLFLKGTLLGAVAGVIIGTIAGVYIGSPKTMSKSGEILEPSIARVDETSTLSLIEDIAPFQLYRQIDFIDRDLDRKTVERYVVTEYGDAGTGVSSSVIMDLDRSDMFDSQASRIDGDYQRFLAGEFKPSQRLLVNRFKAQLSK